MHLCVLHTFQELAQQRYRMFDCIHICLNIFSVIVFKKALMHEAIELQFKI